MPASINISVIIPVFNREVYISESIKSVLAQTRQDFELIVVDDGSTDRTADVVNAFDDSRIRLVSHDHNRGISQARNTGLDYVRGKYIAWLDSDDHAFPNRLAEQSRYLESHENIAMVGACAGLCGPNGERLPGFRIPPLVPDDVRAWLLFRSPFQQSSIFGRTEVLSCYRYREELSVCEDFDLDIHVSRDHPVCNMAMVLIDRRIHPHQIMRKNIESIKTENRNLVTGQLHYFGLEPSTEDLELHSILPSFLKSRDISTDMDFLDWAEHWLTSLRKTNAENGLYSQQSINFATGFFWAKACHLAIPTLGVARAGQTFLASPLAMSAFSSHGCKWLLSALTLCCGGYHRFNNS